MFRNPRENKQRLAATPVPPSVGRPPSPPTTPLRKPPPTIHATPRPAPIMTAAPPTTLPTIGRGGTTPRGAASAKTKGAPNASILSFFKKAEDAEEELFVRTGPPRAPGGLGGSGAAFGRGLRDGLRGEAGGAQENGSVKRRKIAHCASGEDALRAGPLQEASGNAVPTANGRAREKRVTRSAGPFVEDDSEEEDGDEKAERVGPDGPERSPRDRVEPPALDESGTGRQVASAVQQDTLDMEDDSETRSVATTSAGAVPRLKQEETSVGDVGDFAEFQDLGDFEEDLYEDGDELAEQRWMEEQALLEAEQTALEEVDLTNDMVKQEGWGEPAPECYEAENAASCPICDISLGGVADQDAAIHVNNCLDGNPTPLPAKSIPSPTKADVAAPSPPKQADRFRKAPRAPKPGQANPFILGEKKAASGSAFSKLMSGHAEDAAWADAAASERESRGKPAYQRMCPFYKILPGFNICVDAFRYGAVQGCRAYFLSHFHSDHYIGLTAQWCHGPIYCSKVTANLVKQQLRVDPQYVIALDWETKVEVPGSNGVSVTMISANHCPGSSLFLYEKLVGMGKQQKLQRVLHCGDFRACRAHVEHPLLRPDVIDAVSGKKRDQKLDVCYLDTTYLNPKYAFPPQEAVIKACADMCVSLSKVRADDSDGWETMKRERAGAGMVKFIKRDSEEVEIKQEDGPEKDEDAKPTLDAMAVMQRANARHRGRLLVVVGTYSIGKERICMGIARALDSKIYAPPGKQRICRALEDPELQARLTTDPTEAQVHMTPLFEIRAETLDDYLKDYRDHFSRAVGFRPSGWNYRPPNSRFTESPSVGTVLRSEGWRSAYSMRDLVAQRGSTGRASCFGVPYSEHSSFRELTVFCCALRIDRIIPTVNVGNAKSREKMKGWCEKWAAERKKNGVFVLKEGDEW